MIIQDKDVANTFLNEFNEMWGSTGAIPNTSLSKFGPFKSNNFPHAFTVGGNKIEVYFCPTDSVGFQVNKAMASANYDMYFGMLSFSSTDIADSLIKTKNKGVFVAGAIDQTSQFYTPISSVSAALGNNFKIYSKLTSVYHDKVLIVDPSNKNSDPQVLTGSFNWTKAADAENDENMIVVHDDTIANIYYQAFHQNFSSLGGTLPNLNDINDALLDDSNVQVFPNPFTNQFNVLLELQQNAPVELVIYNTLGQVVYKKNIYSNAVSISDFNIEPGFYTVKLNLSENSFVAKKIIKQ